MGLFDFMKKGNKASSGKTYTEKDNMGTRHDTFSKASSYWMFERPNLSVRPPFTLFYFSSAQDAEAALLELPYIHKASDSGKLVCDRLMHFGFYELVEGGKGLGRFEALVCGSDLTLEEFNQAEDAFKRHGGKLKSHDEPTEQVTAKSGVGNASKVKYKETTRGDDGISVYEVYTGPDKASAMEFLKGKPVNKKQYYLVVETPEGNFCRDIMGFYQE